MRRETGRLKSKTVLRTGTNTDGHDYRIMQFTIVRQENKKPLIIPFTATGKLADVVYNTIAYNERIVVEYTFKSFFHEQKNRYYPELIATSIEKWVPKKHVPVVVNGKEVNAPDPEFTPTTMSINFNRIH